MSNTNRRAAPQRQPPPRDSNRPPDPTHFTNRAHMCKISNENGPEMTVWHYRLTKHHHHDNRQQQKQRTSPQEMLIELIDALSSDGNHYFLVKQNTDTITAVTSDDITENPDIYNFVSSYTNLPKASSTSLLIRIASNQANNQHNERPIDNISYKLEGKWTIHPDNFQGKKSCMVGVFSNIIHEGVSWDDTAEMIAQEVLRKSNAPTKPRIETRPVKFGWTDEGKEKQTTIVAVYAAVDIIAEVKGICMRLAFEPTDSQGLGLLNSQFHEMANMRSGSDTRRVILSQQERFVSKHSICTISAETRDLDGERPTTEICQQLLPTSIQRTNNIKSMRDLMYAFIKNEQCAEFTNVSTFEYPRGDEGFKFTVPNSKLHAFYEAILKLDSDHRHHFARSRPRSQPPNSKTTKSAKQPTNRVLRTMPPQ